jgi:hypothetical protein
MQGRNQMSQNNNQSEQKTELKGSTCRNTERAQRTENVNDESTDERAARDGKEKTNTKGRKTSNVTQNQKWQNHQSPPQRQQSKNQEEPKREDQSQQKARNSFPEGVHCSVAKIV